MDTRQLLRQLHWLGEQTTWSDGGARVFGTVRVVAPGGTVLAPARVLPALLIEPVESEPAGEHSRRLRTTVRLHLVADNRNDADGQASVLDGAHTTGSSAGAGLARLAGEVRRVFGTLTTADGVTGVAWLRGPELASARERLPARAVFTLHVEHTDSADFPPTVGISAVAGVGQVDLTWTLPPARFDLTGVTVRRATGAPPADTESGTLVYNGSGTGVTDGPVPSGTELHYAIWGTYDADVALGATPETDTASDIARTASATPL